MPGSHTHTLGPARGVESEVALDGRGDPHKDHGLDDGVDDVRAAQHHREVVVVGTADRTAAGDSHEQAAGDVADHQAQQIQRNHGDGGGQQSSGHQVRNGPDRQRVQRVDLLVDALGAELRGEAAAGLHRESEGCHHRRQLTRRDQGRNKSRGRAQADDVQQVVGLDTDQRADGGTQHRGDTDGPAAGDQRAVTPRDVGQQPEEFLGVVAQGVRDRGDGLHEEGQHVPESPNRLGDPLPRVDDRLNALGTVCGDGHGAAPISRAGGRP